MSVSPFDIRNCRTREELLAKKADIKTVMISMVDQGVGNAALAEVERRLAELDKKDSA